MARPKKNNADYFSHDNDMRNDDKILSVRRKFGHEWYSIWNMLLEKLCKSDWFIIDVDNISLELLSWDFMIEPDKLSQIIDYFVYIKLIVKKDEKIYSQKLIDRFAWLLSKRKRDIDYRWQKQDKEVVIDVENPQSKVKESKVYNNIIKPSIQEIEKYIKQKWININVWEFYLHYEKTNWTQNDWTPIKFWKRAVSTRSKKIKLWNAKEWVEDIKTPQDLDEIMWEWFSQNENRLKFLSILHRSWFRVTKDKEQINAILDRIKEISDANSIVCDWILYTSKIVDIKDRCDKNDITYDPMYYLKKFTK